MTRRCESCPSRVLMNHTRCFACRQLREREQATAQRRKAGAKPYGDYPAHVIEARWLRAVWQKNPRKAQALLRRAA